MSSTSDTFVVIDSSYEDPDTWDYVWRVLLVPVSGGDILRSAPFPAYEGERLSYYAGHIEDTYFFVTYVRIPWQSDAVKSVVSYDAISDTWHRDVEDLQTAFTSYATSVGFPPDGGGFNSSPLQAFLPGGELSLWTCLTVYYGSPVPSDRRKLIIRYDLSSKVFSTVESVLNASLEGIQLVSDRWISDGNQYVSRATPTIQFGSLQRSRRGNSFSVDGEYYIGMNQGEEGGAPVNIHKYPFDPALPAYSAPLGLYQFPTLIPNATLSGSAVLTFGPDPVWVTLNNVFEIASIIPHQPGDIIGSDGEVSPYIHDSHSHFAILHAEVGEEVCEEVYDEEWDEWYTDCDRAPSTISIRITPEIGPSVFIKLGESDYRDDGDWARYSIVGSGNPIQVAGSFWTSFKNTEEII